MTRQLQLIELFTRNQLHSSMEIAFPIHFFVSLTGLTRETARAPLVGGKKMFQTQASLHVVARTARFRKQ